MRAIDVVDRALQVCDGPVYVRKEIIHNRYVVDELRGKGAVFVEEVNEVPDGAWLIYSAHGISPTVRGDARRKRLRTIDATCPLVTKVHLEAIQYARKNYTIILIGHDDHDETIGTLGEAPGIDPPGRKPEEAEAVEIPDPDRVAYLTQTTLSLDDTREIVEILKRRSPTARPAQGGHLLRHAEPAGRGACDGASRGCAPVLGAPNSSNSLRLCEVGRAPGCSVVSHRAGRRTSGRSGSTGVRVLGLTASASAPEILVREVVRLRAREARRPEVEEFETVQEDVSFSLPQSSSRSSSSPLRGKRFDRFANRNPTGSRH